MLVCGDRHRNPVVLRLAEHFALARANTHNRVRNPVYADFFADRIAVAQKVIHNVVADDHIVCPVFIVGRRKAAAHRDLGTVQVQASSR